jgi:hypothetical protein
MCLAPVMNPRHRLPYASSASHAMPRRGLRTRTFDLSPIQGVSIGDRFPGLKPWAESSSPFGADPLDRLTGAKQIPGFQPVSGLATSKTLEIMGSVARLASRDGKGMNARKSSWRAVHPDHPKNPRTRTRTGTV